MFANECRRTKVPRAAGIAGVANQGYSGLASANVRDPDVLDAQDRVNMCDRITAERYSCLITVSATCIGTCGKGNNPVGVHVPVTTVTETDLEISCL